MSIESALRQWEAECWEQYNHENDYEELLEYSELEERKIAQDNGKSTK